MAGWTPGTPEVAVAVADEQTAGMGQAWPYLDRAASRGAPRVRWVPPRGPRRTARLAARATVSLAMLDAAEDVAGLRDGTLGLKWPNDIVADGPDGPLRKVAGVLGEATLDDDRVVSAAVGIGINGDWSEHDFPPDLAPLDDEPPGAVRRPTHRPDTLLDCLAAPPGAPLRGATGRRFDAGGWSSRQRTTGHTVENRWPRRSDDRQGARVDPESGALLIVGDDGRAAHIDSGDVTRCRVVALPGRPVSRR